MLLLLLLLLQLCIFRIVNRNEIHSTSLELQLLILPLFAIKSDGTRQRHIGRKRWLEVEPKRGQCTGGGCHF